MEIYAILLVSYFIGMASSVNGYAGGGWTNAHATFYGGGDASGTMGTQLFWVALLLNCATIQPYVMYN